MRFKSRRRASASPDIARTNMQGPRRIHEGNRGSDEPQPYTRAESIAVSLRSCLMPEKRRSEWIVGNRSVTSRS